MLTEEIVYEICKYLSIQEILQFSYTCKLVNSMIQSDKIWKYQCRLFEFHGCFLRDILAHSCIFNWESVNYRIVFQQKYQLALSQHIMNEENFSEVNCPEVSENVEVLENDIIDEENHLQVLENVEVLENHMMDEENHVQVLHSRELNQESQLNHKLQEIVQKLKSIQDPLSIDLCNLTLNHEMDDTSNIIEQSVIQLLELIDDYPLFIPAYRILAFTAFIVNDFDSALKLIHYGKSIEDCGFDELHDEILEILNKKKLVIFSSKEDTEKNSNVYPRLSQKFIQILTEIFNRFDIDQDGRLNKVELSQYILFTSNTTLDFDSYRHFVLKYGGKRKRNDSMDGIQVSGFLNFYLDQSIVDPDETIKDIEKCGYSIE